MNEQIFTRKLGESLRSLFIKMNGLREFMGAEELYAMAELENLQELLIDRLNADWESSSWVVYLFLIGEVSYEAMKGELAEIENDWKEVQGSAPK